MAKIYGLFGTMKGKVADVVMTVRNGEQIVRKYQPSVFNPSTAAQVATRAKLKALSQLSAVLAPVIAIPRNGTVSSRNLFTKLNYPIVTFADNTAEVPLASVQLTRSSVGFGLVSAVRGADAITVGMNLEGAAGNISRVAYVLVTKGADGKARYVGQTVVNTPGPNNTFNGSLPLVEGDCVIYAYGIRDNTENARVIFGNLNVPTAEMIANLLTSRTLTESDVTVTETVSRLLAAQV